MKKEYSNPKDYFPYIGHRIDHDKQGKVYIYKLIIGDLFNKANIHRINENKIEILNSSPHLFRRIIINGLAPHLKLVKDPDTVVVITPRHRTLYDYTAGQPIHHELLNPEVMLLAGNNLFVSKYDQILRTFGAIMFLRGDAWLKYKGLPRVYLSRERYVNEIFPAYLREQMIEGTRDGTRKIRHDLIIYPEQEKNPVTNIREGGRTKTGKLRGLSPILFDKLKGITRDTPVRVYVAAANISFSKVPDVPFIVHSDLINGVNKKMRYFIEQLFVYYSYPRYVLSHPEARLDIEINYGKPELLAATDFNSTKDLLKYSKDLKEKIGRLESVFPIQFLYRILDEDVELPILTLEEKAKQLYAQYYKTGINIDNISSRSGEMLPVKDMIDASITLINSNPAIHIKHMARDNFLSFNNGRLYSYDSKVQTWYANNLKHLDSIG